MAESLIFHIPTQRWLRCGRDGRVIDEGSGRPPAAGDTPVVALADMADCLCLTASLPELSGRRLNQALPYALEDRLAGSIDEQHVAAAGRDDTGDVRALVIERTRLQHYLDTLKSAGIEPTALLPDALCLPWRKGELSVMAAGDRLLARWGDWQAASLEPALFGTLLPELAVDRIRCFGDLPDGFAAGEILVEQAPGGLNVLVPRAAAMTGQLLTGELAPATSRRHHARWLWAAALAGVLILSQFLLAGLEYLQLRGQAQTSRAEVATHFSQAFPGITPVAGREKLLAERELARLRFGEAAGFIELLAAAAPVIESTEQTEVQSLDYRDGALEIRLRADSIAELERLERRLSDAGVDAGVQSASTYEDGADGRLLVRGAGS